MADLHCIQPGPVVDIVAVVGVYGLLDGARVDPGEAAEGRGEVAIGARVVGGPTGAALRPIEIAVAAVATVTAAAAATATSIGRKAARVGPPITRGPIATSPRPSADSPGSIRAQ